MSTIHPYVGHCTGASYMYALMPHPCIDMTAAMYSDEVPTPCYVPDVASALHKPMPAHIVLNCP